MAGKWATRMVQELQEQGLLLVEDGNHGEYRPRSIEFVPVGTVFVRAADMNGGRVLFESASRINEVAFQRIRKGVGAPGDVLLSHKGTVGKIAYVPIGSPPFVCSPQTTFWRSLDQSVIDQRFLYYFLCSTNFQQQLVARKGETDMADYVSLTSQRRLIIDLPPLKEQQSIAYILGALDDKIECNCKMNKTLEEIIGAIFKSWFVAFDSVRSKSVGKNLPELSSHIAELFPDGFEDSELGRIPRGWKVSGLNETGTFLNGLALQKYPPQGEQSLPVIKIAQLRKGSTIGADQASADIDSAYIVEDGDVLFSWSGSLHCILWSGGRGALNQHLFKVTSESFPKWFYYLWIRYHLPHFRHIAEGKATTMGHIQRKHLAEAKVLIPSNELLCVMDQLLAPYIQALVCHSIECRKLADLRDALLPKLISGELRIADAERIIGRHI